ncbi:MAG: NAD(P)-dependent oxidoreductase [Alphaproteobacteria bacterium]
MKHVKLLSLRNFSDEQMAKLNAAAKVTAYRENVAGYDENEIIARLEGADIALVNPSAPVSKQALAARPGLRFIVSSTMGINHIDLAACREAGVRVRWFPGYCARTLAEHAFAMILMGLHFMIPAIDNVRAKRWDYLDFRARETPGRRLLILGLGQSGSHVKQFAEAFGMEVSWTNSKTPATEVDALIARADVISMHMALNDGTRQFMDRRRLNLMKPGVVLVNTARGAMVEEDALWEFMERNPGATAFLDVLEHEPPAPDHRLYRLKNVVVTPHMAWHSEEGAAFLWRAIFEALMLAIKDEWPASDETAGWL